MSAHCAAPLHGLLCLILCSGFFAQGTEASVYIIMSLSSDHGRPSNMSGQPAAFCSSQCTPMAAHALTMLPSEGSACAHAMRVCAQVTKLNPRLASLDILCVGSRPLDATFAGIIRWDHTSKSTHAVIACCWGLAIRERRPHRQPTARRGRMLSRCGSQSVPFGIASYPPTLHNLQRCPRTPISCPHHIRAGSRTCGPRRWTRSS